MLLPLVISPIIGFILAYIAMVGIYWVFRGANPHRANRGFRYAQILSAALVSFSHGTNDAKTMGIITAALLSGGFIKVFAVPIWVIVAAAAAISFGTYAGGWRIIRTMGTRLYKIEPAQGSTRRPWLLWSSREQVTLVFRSARPTSSLVRSSARAQVTARPECGGCRTQYRSCVDSDSPAAAIMAGVIYAVLHIFGT
jgi:hypothetical protein